MALSKGKERRFKFGFSGFPGAESISDWVMLLREAPYFSIDEMVAVHTALHKTFGEKPSEAVYDGERTLSKQMRSCGLEHRYKDELSKAAGTLVENPVAPDPEELSLYLQPATVQTGAITLSQGVENPEPIFLGIDNTILPKNMNKAARNMVQKSMPPDVVLQEMPAAAPEDFARQLPAFDLMLEPRGTRIIIQPFAKLLKEAPRAVTKSHNGKQVIQADAKIISFEERKLVHKFQGTQEATEIEKFVLAVVLYPEREDVQGDVYSKDEVRKGCHWWAEFSGQFSNRHVLQGGKTCAPGEIAMLENYIMPVTCTIGKEEIPAGSWMLGSGIRNDMIWQQILNGELNAYSIGAEATVIQEEVAA